MSIWPDGHNFAATLSFDFDAEEVWIGENAANEHKPGVLSQGNYSARVGTPLLLDLLAEHAVRATFFVCGKDAQRYPELMERVVAAGHELAHHGDSHVSPTMMSFEEEKAELLRGLEKLRTFGSDVVGYRSPSWDFSPNTLDLLGDLGFQYSSNLMNDIRPYLHEKRDIVELPVSWILDDAAHFWFDSDTWTKTIRSADEVYSIWSEELQGIAKLGAHFMLTMHPQFIGRPGRMPLLEKIIRDIKNKNGWIATAREIADWHRDELRHVEH